MKTKRIFDKRWPSSSSVLAIACVVTVLLFSTASVLITSRDEVERSSPSESLPLIALIISDAAPGSFERRRVIRETWCNAEARTSSGATCRFVLSATPYSPASAEEAIASENSSWGDILRVDTGGAPDSWQSLPVKVVSAMRWASSSSAIVLKTDHDCWVNLPGLSSAARSVVASAGKGGNVYWGSFYFASWPKSDVGSKYFDAVWRASRFSSMRYPPYASGPGYVLSPSLVAVVASWKEPPVSLLEDVTIGDVVSRGALGAKLVHDPLRLVTRRTRICFPGMLLKHCANNLADIASYHNNTRDRGNPCSSGNADLFPDPL